MCKKNNLEPQLIPLKEWIKAWKDFKQWFEQFKK
jgi:hypothetical protein